MIKIDLHVHSKYSHDGSMRVERLIKTALEKGLDGIAICDHNKFAAYEEAVAIAPENFLIIPGVEYSTDCGHVLALFVTKEYDLPRNKKRFRMLDALRKEADKDGALLVAAHPYRHRSTLPEKLIPLMDGVEVENSRDAMSAPGNSIKALASAKEYDKFITGGSDAHIAREIGCRYTVFPKGTELTLEGIKSALEKGLSKTGGDTGRLRYQAMGKLRKTRLKKIHKDIGRLIVYTVKDLMK